MNFTSVIHRPPLPNPLPHGGEGTNRKTSHAGYSLIELVTVIAMISAVMMSSTLLYVALLRSEQNTALAVVEQQTLARLATQFRRDAHRAVSATVVDDAAGWDFASATMEPVRYRLTGDRVERTAPVAEGTHRETFRIRHGTWSFEPAAEGSPIVALQLSLPVDAGQPPSASASQATKSWRIEASLGLTPSPPMTGGEP